MILLPIVFMTALISVVEIHASAPNPAGTSDEIIFHLVSDGYDEIVSPCQALQGINSGRVLAIKLNGADLCSIVGRYSQLHYDVNVTSDVQEIMSHFDDLKALLSSTEQDETAEVQAKLKKEIAEIEQAATQLAAKKAFLTAKQQALNFKSPDNKTAVPAASTSAAATLPIPSPVDHKSSNK